MQEVGLMQKKALMQQGGRGMAVEMNSCAPQFCSGPADPESRFLGSVSTSYGAGVTKDHRLGGLKPQKCILTVLEPRSSTSRCWWNELKAVGENMFCASLSALVSLAILGVPWISDTSLQPLPLSSRGPFPLPVIITSSLCLGGQLSYWIKDHPNDLLLT